MKHIKSTILLIALISLPLFAQTPKFELRQNDLILTRTAQPHQYMDKIGTKAALMGFENGSFEMWIWPWKVLRNFDLQFFIGTTTQPILSKDIVREISVTPEATTITFVYESFTVKEIIFIPYDKPGAVILLDVYTTTPLTIVPGFTPVMQPQWPAGIGGQYSYWDDNLKAYIISESQRRGIFVCGSSIAEQMAAPPAHMFADNPIQFKFTVEPNKANENFYPIVIAGMHKQPRDSVFALYKDLMENVEKYYTKTYEHYKNLCESTIQITTPDKKINLAFEFGKVALSNLMVENPTLGKGLVAGYGLSGGGGRPGFAWYFGGDAFINSLAINSYGDYQTVKDALIFTQKWQRQENFPIRKKSKDEKPTEIGKMAHELSQSDGLVDWWNDYHYGYNHADTTPWYLVAMGDYFRKSGDVEFIKKNWKSIVQAYNWCLTKDSNGDGLMDLKGAGLGVLEFGALVKINNDMYTQGLWTQGIKEVNLMAKYVNDKEIEKASSVLLPKAVLALEKIFWMEDLGYYSFGASDDGKKVRDKNIFPTSIMIFDFLDKTRCENSIKHFNESDLMTDWGVRNLSNKSSLYEPTNYNYGTVWGFNSLFANASQYKYHFNLSAFSLLRNTLQHAFDYGLGIFPEVFSGDINTKLGEAYHNQGFCTSGYIFPMMTGMLGLNINALENKLTFAPKLPMQWEWLDIKNIKVGKATLNLTNKLKNGEWKLTIEKAGEGEINFEFMPDLFLGSEINSVTIDGKSINFEVIKHEQAVQLKAAFVVSGKHEVVARYNPSVEIYLLDETTPIGATNGELKIISQNYSGKKLSVQVEVLPGKEYKLGIINENLVGLINGAKETDGILSFTAEGKADEFVKHEIKIEMK
ncbi:MAG: GH116 family glycosyl hydrolase [Bacteroidota bacterium]